MVLAKGFQTHGIYRMGVQDSDGETDNLNLFRSTPSILTWYPRLNDRGD